MRIAGILLLLISLFTFGFWAFSGFSSITLYEQPERYTEVDEFGDEVERERMVEDFTFGLTPSDKFYDGALPIGGTAGALGALLLGLSFRSRRDRDVRL